MSAGPVDDLQIGRIQGFLQAFEELNQLNNHVAGFFFEPLGAAVDPRRQVAEFLSAYWGGDIATDGCELEPKPDWRAWIERSADEHMFAFLTGPVHALFMSDEQRVQRRSDMRQRLPISDVLRSFFKQLDVVIGESPVIVSVVRCADRCISDALWDAYLIQAGDRLLLLWFGWSD